jgi:predicted nucleic acid-binding protein
VILVDTSIWIEWSNRPNSEEAQELARLLEADQVATTDVIIAEVLQGARNEQRYGEWANQLDALHYYPVQRATWLQAASLSFRLRRAGLTTPLADLVIAAVGLENDLPVYATDPHFQRVQGLKLHQVGG